MLRASPLGQVTHLTRSAISLAVSRWGAAAVVAWWLWRWRQRTPSFRVWPRKVLQLNASDYVVALSSALASEDAEARDKLKQDVAQLWCGRPNADAIVTLSVRTAFDLYLQVQLGAEALHPGDEVLMTAINIKDMARIVRHHGLIPVPVDLDPETMAPQPDLLLHALSNRSRMLLVAHIFGTRMPMQPLVEFAQHHQLILVEDCAECFTSINEYNGCDAADLSLFSFGTIKTCSALGGCVARVSDPLVLDRMRRREAEYPIRPRSYWMKRALVYSVFTFSGRSRFVTGFAMRSLQALGYSFDAWIIRNVRGFSGPHLIRLLRRQPSYGLLSTLRHRLRRHTRAYVDRRIRLGTLLAQLLGDRVERPGARARYHCYWLFPVVVSNPHKVCAVLTRHGFDCTQGASQLAWVTVPPSVSSDPTRCAVLDPVQSRRMLEHIVYLPLYPEMDEASVRQLATLTLLYALPLAPTANPIAAAAATGPATTSMADERAQRLQQLQQRTFDVLVVGGGVNGAATAREAALRGLSVLLVDKGDWARGASSNSAKMVHGGLRYLHGGYFSLVRRLCRARDLQRKLNPNRVSPMTFVMPMYKASGSVTATRLALLAYDLFSLFGNHRLSARIAAKKAPSLVPGLNMERLRCLLTWSDCRVDDARLTWDNVADAAANGAVTLNYISFQNLQYMTEFADTGLCVTHVRDELTKENYHVRCRHVVYATGSWMDAMPGMAISTVQRAVAPRKGTQIAVLSSRLPLQDCISGRNPTDDRYCFMVPFFNVTVIGTTDQPHDVSSGPVPVPTLDDVKYLLAMANHHFPDANLEPEDVHTAWCGVRPLAVQPDSWIARAWLRVMHALFQPNPGDHQVSRDVRVFRVTDHITGVVGGKLGNYRDTAEAVMAHVLPGVERVVQQRKEMRELPVANPVTQGLSLELGLDPRLGPAPWSESAKHAVVEPVLQPGMLSMGSLAAAPASGARAPIPSPRGRGGSMSGDYGGGFDVGGANAPFSEVGRDTGSGVDVANSDVSGGDVGGDMGEEGERRVAGLAFPTAFPTGSGYVSSAPVPIPESGRGRVGGGIGGDSSESPTTSFSASPDSIFALHSMGASSVVEEHHPPGVLASSGSSLSVLRHNGSHGGSGTPHSRSSRDRHALRDRARGPHVDGVSYVDHLWWYFGSRCTWIQARLASHPHEAARLVDALPFRMAEISWAVIGEQAVRLEDVLVRRLGVFYRDVDCGLRCAHHVAHHMAGLLGKDKDWVLCQVRDYSAFVGAIMEWKQHTG